MPASGRPLARRATPRQEGLLAVFRRPWWARLARVLSRAAPSEGATLSSMHEVISCQALSSGLAGFAGFAGLWLRCEPGAPPTEENDDNPLPIGAARSAKRAVDPH